MRYSLTAAAICSMLFATACGGEQTDEPAEPEKKSLSIDLELTTESGSIGANHDDEYCAWKNPTYVLRDGTGSIIATGDVKSDIDGEATVGGEPAEIGEVASPPSDYECVLPSAISADTADFYELEVATQQPMLGDQEFTQKVTFSREDAETTSIVVEFTP